MTSSPPTVPHPANLGALRTESIDAQLFDYLLRLGDDSLILGQRLTEWCGIAPALETDLSLANIALDLLGQATLFLELAGRIEGVGRDADRLAFHRDVLGFRNCLMVEQPNGDFAQTIARQFLFSTAQLTHFEHLTRSNDPRISEIAAKAIKEVQYHAELAADWVIRLGDGTEESHRRMTKGLDWHWRFVDEMFDRDEIEGVLVNYGIAPDRSQLRAAFDQRIAEVLTEATLPLPQYPRGIKGGRTGHHSEHLGHLLAVMQHLPRAYPDARW
jgi:ring-1,2-phenylacetyl-CoA epoxidase subunit PaaC